MKRPQSYLLFNIYLISLCFLASASILRILLSSLEISAYPFYYILAIVPLGALNDLMALIYFLIPLWLILLVLPSFLMKRSGFRLGLTLLLCCFTLFFGLFTSIGEFFFWQEFQSRFDFIAVDYLVYTAEVIGNIKETYNVNLIIASCLLASFLTAGFIIFKTRKTITSSLLSRLKSKLTLAILLAGLIGIDFYVLPLLKIEPSNNRVVNELSKNGLYELFSAFRNNELDFDKHYSTLPIDEMYRSLLQNTDLHKSPLSKGNLSLLIRNENSTNPLVKKNIVVILVESLGANFLTRFGNKQGITPQLDQLAQQSLSLDRIFATGTRTVRGLEAVSLSMPPTPGFSILKRPNNENLKGIHSVLKKFGYSYDFIYGGYGYFDNMNYFFQSNGYGIFDRSDIPPEDVVFSNIWGVSDEDLLNFSLKNIDSSFQKGKPFFKLILTTSNHRPYSYPEGRIDIPSKSGRDGAVKFTDYAIGKFINDARGKEWFKDTVFIVMADHSADGRGTIAIPFKTYHIPAIIYAPGFVKAGKVTQYGSQIDVLPTVFDLLGFKYESSFIGSSLLKSSPLSGKAYSGTYQNVGCFDQKSHSFVSLGTKKMIKSFNVELDTNQLVQENLVDSHSAEFCNSLYQYLSLIWKNGLMKDSPAK